MSKNSVTAALLVAAAVGMNLVFGVLGAVFDYPNVLAKPAADQLTMFRHNEVAVVTCFALLALTAALLIPIAIRVGALASSRAMRVAVVAGIAAAIVQVIGLARWPIVVPFLADRAAHGDTHAVSQFEMLGNVVGGWIGETLGYLLTATWTVLVVVALTQLPQWFRVTGVVSAGLIAVGALVKFDVPGADIANFLGYVVWSGWLIAFAVLLRNGRTVRPSVLAPEVAAMLTPSSFR
ncbi:DUF4386 family protein [Smaragdicoccus niigatensis]|uniref:DUF4386 family protein n=1 Tax=Smaragdicoccus niigatensis TaxID=359359 RepID=UPI000381D69E|nr:DUF4386 family protein [Smaragdicoccus niigatensis]